MVSGHAVSFGFQVDSWPVHCDDAGEYKVAAKNALNNGVWVFQARNLTVLCRPVPDPNHRSPYVQNALLGSNIDLQINYVGYPPPNITWERDGNVLSLSRQRNAHNETALVINDVGIDDYGVYVFTLANGIGSSRTTYKLLPEGAPQRPTDLEFYNVTSNTVTLHWKSGFDMGRQQHFTVWKLFGKSSYETISQPIYDTSSTHGINQTWTYVQTLLTSDTEYHLSINADNNNGRYNSGYATPVARFRTLKSNYPHIHTSPSTNVAVILGPTLGGIGLLGAMAFMVYIIYYRRRRTRYAATESVITSKEKH